MAFERFVPEYHHAKFGCNWATNKGETMWLNKGETVYMVPKDNSLNKVKIEWNVLCMK